MGSRALNLDTYILLHALAGVLEPRERHVLNGDGDWGISAIVLWEIEKLYQKGRILYGLDYPPLADSPSRLQVWPITATSFTYGVPLVTRDARIRVSKVIRCL